MDIQLLVVEDCPHETVAAKLLRRALDDVGLTHVDFATRTVSTAEQAADAHFVGSPTFLIDGRDPFASSGAAPAVACRVYSTPAGLAGLPAIEPLRQALKEAADPLRLRSASATSP